MSATLPLPKLIWIGSTGQISHYRKQIREISLFIWKIQCFSSVQFSCSVMSDSWRPHGLQHARFPCPSPTPRACSNSCPSSQWCHPTISSSVIPFSFCLQSFPASGSFPMSQLFALGGQSIGISASASVFPMIKKKSLFMWKIQCLGETNLRSWE